MVRSILKNTDKIPFEIRTILNKNSQMFLCVYLKCEYCKFMLCPWCYIHGIIES